MTATVKDTDKGLKRLIDRLGQKFMVSVGIHDSEGLAPHKQQERSFHNIDKAGSAEPSLIEIAGFHEFGFGVPRRSFIADWFDQNEQSADKMLRSLCGNHVRGAETLKVSLTKFGTWAVGQIQERIAANIPPPLERSTIRQKHGKTTPLINTGQLRSSIRSRVRIEK